MRYVLPLPSAPATTLAPKGRPSARAEPYPQTALEGQGSIDAVAHTKHNACWLTSPSRHNSSA